MFWIFLMLLFVAVAILAPRFIKDIQQRKRDREGDIVDVTISLAPVRWGVRAAGSILAVLCFLMTSCLIIDSDKVGHLTRIYMGSKMPSGRIIANTNEKGPQAEILPPGFHMIPFIRVTHSVEEMPIVHVEEGTYGFLVAKDGRAMPEGQFLAPAWESADDMINAMKFMGYDNESTASAPTGVKGPQLTVLPPGHYRINRYLFDIFAGNITDVPIGHVAVVKSNVGEIYKGDPILPTGVEKTTLSVPIVPKGYKGVWDTVLKPDRYYLNEKAYDITIIPLRFKHGNILVDIPDVTLISS